MSEESQRAPSRPARAVARVLLPLPVDPATTIRRGPAAPPAYPGGQPEVMPGGDPRLLPIGDGDVGVGGGEGADLGDDVRAIALVEGQQQRQVGVQRARQVAGEQRIGEIGAATRCEVHQQEGEVGGDIAVAHAIVELDAVQDADIAGLVSATGLEGDRGDLEVAVAVADPALLPAAAQQVRVGVEEARHVGAQRVEGRAIDRVADGGPRLLEVLRPVPFDDRPGAELGDRGAALGPQVELRDDPGDGADVGSRDATPGQDRFEHAVGGQAPHDDRIVDGVRVAGAAGAQRESVPVGPDRLDAQVDVGAEAAVALNLGGAHAGALVGGREVEEAEIDGLLDLVDPVAGEDDEADVRLHEQAGFGPAGGPERGRAARRHGAASSPGHRRTREEDGHGSNCRSRADAPSTAAPSRVTRSRRSRSEVTTTTSCGRGSRSSSSTMRSSAAFAPGRCA